jgi:hypothetical protein
MLIFILLPNSSSVHELFLNDFIKLNRLNYKQCYFLFLSYGLSYFGSLIFPTAYFYSLMAYEISLVIFARDL